MYINGNPKVRAACEREVYLTETLIENIAELWYYQRTYI